MRHHEMYLQAPVSYNQPVGNLANKVTLESWTSLIWGWRLYIPVRHKTWMFKVNSLYLQQYHACIR